MSLSVVHCADVCRTLEKLHFTGSLGLPRTYGIDNEDEYDDTE